MKVLAWIAVGVLIILLGRYFLVPSKRNITTTQTTTVAKEQTSERGNTRASIPPETKSEVLYPADPQAEGKCAAQAGGTVEHWIDQERVEKRRASRWASQMRPQDKALLISPTDVIRTSNHYNRRLQKCLILIEFEQGDLPPGWVVLGARENYEMLACFPLVDYSLHCGDPSADLAIEEASKRQYQLMTE